MSPTAYLKVQFACHHLDREVGGYGFAPDPKRPLYITDFKVLPQISTKYHTSLDRNGIADYFEEMGEAGHQLSQFGRIWIHTHPVMAAKPSHEDEMTFAEQFDGVDWAVMAIISKTGDTYARLKINTGPGAEIVIPWRIDWAEVSQFNETRQTPNYEEWALELARRVEIPSAAVEQMLRQRTATTPPLFKPQGEFDGFESIATTERFGPAHENVDDGYRGDWCGGHWSPSGDTVGSFRS